MRKIQTVWVAALLCGSLTAYGKDAGWQWYNDPVKLPDPKTTDKSAQVRQEPDIMQKLSALQTATKRALYEAILYPGVDNFVKYFRLQNYWTQQAGLFSMSAKKAMLAHPELDYNLQYSHYNGTVRNQLAATRLSNGRPYQSWLNTTVSCSFTAGRTPLTASWRR